MCILLPDDWRENSKKNVLSKLVLKQKLAVTGQSPPMGHQNTINAITLRCAAGCIKPGSALLQQAGKTGSLLPHEVLLYIISSVF